MEDVDKRLKETSALCEKAFDAWSKDKKDSKVRGELQETVHELRKVLSRIEIEVAISERDQNGQKPIPMPSHRDSKAEKNDNRGNRAPNEGGGSNNKPRGGQRRGSGPKKAQGGDK